MSEPSVEVVPLTSLQPDPKNANKGTLRGAEALEDSLEEFGYLEPGVIDRDNMLVGGNKRVKAALDVGMTEAVIVRAAPNQVVVVKRDDLDLDSNDANTRETSRRAAYALNRVGELSLSWDTAQIEDDLAAGLSLNGMWSEDDLSKMIIKAKALPPVSDQEEPTLVSDHYVQIYCSAADLEAFQPVLAEWMQRDTVTINVA